MRLKSMDEARYAVRSRRQRKSHWSESSNARAAKMLSEGGMTRACIALLPSEILQMWKTL